MASSAVSALQTWRAKITVHALYTYMYNTCHWVKSTYTLYVWKIIKISESIDTVDVITGVQCTCVNFPKAKS